MALTVSGIDPQQVMRLVGTIEQLKSKMSNDLNRVNTEIAGNIRQHYQGTAATALLGKIQSQIPALQDFLDNLVKTMVNNINDDLDDTQNTDNALA